MFCLIGKGGGGNNTTTTTIANALSCGCCSLMHFWSMLILNSHFVSLDLLPAPFIIIVVCVPECV